MVVVYKLIQRGEYNICKLLVKRTLILKKKTVIRKRRSQLYRYKIKNGIYFNTITILRKSRAQGIASPHQLFVKRFTLKERHIETI